MNKYNMSESTYLKVFDAVEDLTDTISHLESIYGLKDTGAVIRNTDIASLTFWSDEDSYIFEIVDEKKFTLFALKYS